MPYVTESADITEEEERLQIEAIRRLGPARRIEIMRRLSKSQLETEWHELQNANPNLSERELQVKAVSIWYGEEFGQRLEKALKETGRWS